MLLSYKILLKILVQKRRQEGDIGHLHVKEEPEALQIASSW